MRIMHLRNAAMQYKTIVKYGRMPHVGSDRATEMDRSDQGGCSPLPALAALPPVPVFLEIGPMDLLKETHRIWAMHREFRTVLAELETTRIASSRSSGSAAATSRGSRTRRRSGVLVRRARAGARRTRRLVQGRNRPPAARPSSAALTPSTTEVLMTTHHNQTGEPWRLPDISRLDRARFVKEARRLRAEQIDRLLLASSAALPGCSARRLVARQCPSCRAATSAEPSRQAAVEPERIKPMQNLASALHPSLVTNPALARLRRAGAGCASRSAILRSMRELNRLDYTHAR